MVTVLPGRSQPSWSLSNHLLHLSDQPSPFQLPFWRHSSCFEPLLWSDWLCSKPTSTLLMLWLRWVREQPPAGKMWPRVTSLHSLGLPLWWEWTSYQLWFTIGGGTPSCVTPLLLIVSAEIASRRSSDFSTSWTTPLCLIAQTPTLIDLVRFAQWSLAHISILTISPDPYLETTLCWFHWHVLLHGTPPFECYHRFIYRLILRTMIVHPTGLLD